MAKTPRIPVPRKLGAPLLFGAYEYRVTRHERSSSALELLGAGGRLGLGLSRRNVRHGSPSRAICVWG